MEPAQRIKKSSSCLEIRYLTICDYAYFIRETLSIIPSHSVTALLYSRQTGDAKLYPGPSLLACAELAKSTFAIVYVTLYILSGCCGKGTSHVTLSNPVIKL